MGISFGLHSVAAFIISLLLVVVTIFISHGRKSARIIVGMLLLAIAAGLPYALAPRRGNVVVMLDLSESTRGADYRNEEHLERRLHQLLDYTKYRVQKFGGSQQTIFDPPKDADAVVLFSDGRFSNERPSPLPSPGVPLAFARNRPGEGVAHTPIYAVVDSKLDHVSDARVISADIIGGHLIAHVVNTVESRTLRTSDGHEQQLGIGSFNLDFLTQANSAKIEILGTDPWPENNSMIAYASPGNTTHRWWIGPRSPGGDWRTLGDLPADLDEYLNTSVIVLNNLAASQISPISQQRLSQYVRDLGGGLVILGGDRAYADYLGTPLEQLSPLSAAPPKAEHQWIILLDSSGSMGEKWPDVLRATREMLDVIPPADAVTIGSFASNVRFFATDTAVSVARDIPSDVAPHGPTNLIGALDALATKGPCDAILITDAEGSIENQNQQAQKLSAAKVKLSALILGSAPATQLKQIIHATAGLVITSSNASTWPTDLKQIVHHSVGSHISRDPITLRFVNDLHNIVGRPVDLWTRLWLRTGAKPQGVAEGTQTVLAATWKISSGNVAALATRATRQEALALTDLVERAPADPNLSLEWRLENQIHVTIDSAGDSKYINNADVQINLNNTRTEIPQTAPGKYELFMPWPTIPSIASVTVNDRVLGRRMIPARYPEEFTAIGNNIENLKQLAIRSGGAVIQPSQTNRIDFHWPRREHDLTALFAIAGGILIAAHLALRRALV